MSEDLKDISDGMKVDFTECAECAAKPGTPSLCPSCIANRDMIYTLKEAVVKGSKALRFIAGVLEEGTARGRPMDLILKGDWDKWWEKVKAFRDIMEGLHR